MSRFSVIYDACVLYPAPLRDLLMRLALTDLFKARWTDAIHAEWMNALMREGRFERSVLERVRDLMDAHVPDAKVRDYENLVDALELPDPSDRHVLAAAIRAHADGIVTFNAKDFPVEVLRPYSIETIHPDDFVLSQLELSPGVVCRAIRSQRQALKNPPKGRDEFLAILQKQQLLQTVSELRQKGYIELI